MSNLSLKKLAATVSCMAACGLLLSSRGGPGLRPEARKRRHSNVCRDQQFTGDPARFPERTIPGNRGCACQQNAAVYHVVHRFLLR